MTKDPVVIVSYARTPIGKLQGQFANYTAANLSKFTIDAVRLKSGLDISQIDEVIMGCVLMAGQGQAPARQAALQAGLDKSTNCTTINKMCGSGMKAVMFGTDALLAGSANIVIAGGMESMSLSPYLLPKARQGLRMGHCQLKDHMFLDGLEDSYEKNTLMGVFAERTAEKYKISRKEQDDFAINSISKAQTAQTNNNFAPEIIAVDEVNADEGLFSFNIDKIPKLKSAFVEHGTVTAANSSSIADGAASLCLMRKSMAQQLGLQPIAKILGSTTFAGAPNWFTTAPIFAVNKLLKNLNMSITDIDLWEINEAFAVVTLAAIYELKLSPELVNIYGGACTLGHPIGASGARILCTLISALQQNNKQIGLATLCIGGGEATALALELC